MRLSQDIKPISYVKANSAKVLDQVNQGSPMIITQNGEAQAVLMGIKTYERLTEGIALLKILSISEKSIEAGEGLPATEAFAHIRSSIKEAKNNG
ncbi:type II toxin-antitoxin system Phd/YefM family antitoxin [Desulfovibrio litoralis]|uniref:Antitoxin n=1 Tax=Desulfovibrio litoralis DSM 11393 TaxID=1121455 RepID=A0A1M7S0N4_9BACT|nr:type II toxin-antitoxin system Phd/YefM family antitoxin [Desulfovibrio litoralis]SHN51996.1 prevent-host-death family protein [Desulfovibrio litoralis DSM 11393]